MDQQERRQFVRDHRTAVFGYGRRDHGPAMTVVYYVIDGDEILVSTMAARGKAKAVRRDPRVSLCVLDENWPLEYLQVYGTASVDDDFESAVDVLRRVIDLMAGETMPSSTRSSIERMVRDEQRVVVNDIFAGGLARGVLGWLHFLLTISVVNLSSNVLGDCVAGLGFLVCIYYGFTGFACTWFYRHELFRSVRNFVPSPCCRPSAAWC